MLEKNRHYNYINGKFLQRLNPPFASINPAVFNDVIGLFPESDEEDLDMAISSAKKVYPYWKKMGMVKRSEYMWKLANIIKKDFHFLSNAVRRESGKITNEAEADVTEAYHMCQYGFAKAFEGVTGKALADEVESKDCFSKLRPRGIVGCISPWNFPMAIPVWEIGMAMMAGNVVILKPSEETPYCGQLLAECIDKAGFPPGVFQMLQGHGENIGWKLVQHPEVNVVLFTGSYEVGAKIKVETAKHHNKICSIETGSKSAVIILDDANIDTLAIPSAIASAFKTAGQRCVSGGRIIVDRKRYAEVVHKFINVAKRLKVGDPKQNDVFYGPMINAAGVIKGIHFNLKVIEEHRKILLNRNEGEKPPNNCGHWLKPFVYTSEWDSKSFVLTNEAFSPHVAIIPANGMEDTVHIYNDTRYGLSVSVITESYRKARFVEENADAGIFYWNLPCIGAGVRMPFGGVKASGNLIPSAAGILPAVTHNTASTYNCDEEIVMAQGLKIEV